MILSFNVAKNEENDNKDDFLEENYLIEIDEMISKQYKKEKNFNISNEDLDRLSNYSISMSNKNKEPKSISLGEHCIQKDILKVLNNSSQSKINSEDSIKFKGLSNNENSWGNNSNSIINSSSDSKKNFVLKSKILQDMSNSDMDHKLGLSNISEHMSDANPNIASSLKGSQLNSVQNYYMNNDMKVGATPHISGISGTDTQSQFQTNLMADTNIEGVGSNGNMYYQMNRGQCDNGMNTIASQLNGLNINNIINIQNNSTSINVNLIQNNYKAQTQMKELGKQHQNQGVQGLQTHLGGSQINNKETNVQIGNQLIAENMSGIGNINNIGNMNSSGNINWTNSMNSSNAINNINNMNNVNNMTNMSSMSNMANISNLNNMNNITNKNPSNSNNIMKSTINVKSKNNSNNLHNINNYPVEDYNPLKSPSMNQSHKNPSPNQIPNTNNKKKRKKAIPKQKTSSNALSSDFTKMDFHELIRNSNTICLHQAGCRYLQNIISENPRIAPEIVYPTMKEELIPLSFDAFGNYYVQKILENLTDIQIREFMFELLPIYFLQVCLSPHGTRVIQKLLEKIYFIPQLLNTFNTYLFNNNNIMEIILDKNSTHIIIKYASLVQAPHNEPWIAFLKDNLMVIVKNQHSCCTLKRCIESFTSLNQRYDLYKNIAEISPKLFDDQYGNYAVQFVLEQDCKDINELIVKYYFNAFTLNISRKISSNIFSKCLDFCTCQTKEMIIRNLCNPKTVKELLFDMYGNYVLQKTMVEAAEPYKSKYIEIVGPLLNDLYKLSFGNIVLHKLVKAFPILNNYRERTLVGNKGNKGSKNSGNGKSNGGINRNSGNMNSGSTNMSNGSLNMNNVNMNMTSGIMTNTNINNGNIGNTNMNMNNGSMNTGSNNLNNNMTIVNGNMNMSNSNISLNNNMNSNNNNINFPNSKKMGVWDWRNSHNKCSNNINNINYNVNIPSHGMSNTGHPIYYKQNIGGTDILMNPTHNNYTYYNGYNTGNGSYFKNPNN